MSRFETITTVAGTVTASMASHILCCGILPLAVNGSLQAVASHLGLQLGMAIATTTAIAVGVTFWEKRRHAHICTHHGHCHFNLRRHLIRNLVIGALAYGFFSLLTHIPAVHEGLEHVFGLEH